MMNWLIVYLIGITVGIVIDNLFWIGVAHFREQNNEQGKS